MEEKEEKQEKKKWKGRVTLKTVIRGKLKKGEFSLKKILEINLELKLPFAYLVNDPALLEEANGKWDVIIFPKQLRELALFTRDLLMKGSIALSLFQAIISTNNSVTLLAFGAPDTKGNAVHQSTSHWHPVRDWSFCGQIAEPVREWIGFHYAFCWNLLLRWQYSVSCI